jgi:tRNA acetyltransferase TAN1
MERRGCSEVRYLLGELGDEEAVVGRTQVSGIIVARTKLDPFQVIEGLRKILAEKPDEFRFTLKFIPIEKVVRTELEEIRLAARELSSKINADEKFRVTLEKRHSELEGMSIVKVAAGEIDRKVDLKNPDKILLIETLGHHTGLSVIKATDILSIFKEKVYL